MKQSVKKYGTEFCFYKFRYYQSVNFLPHRTSADGNCLFNSASLVVTGDESLSTTLRILVCIELFLNAKFYAYHPYLDER